MTMSQCFCVEAMHQSDKTSPVSKNAVQYVLYRPTGRTRSAPHSHAWHFCSSDRAQSSSGKAHWKENDTGGV